MSTVPAPPKPKKPKLPKLKPTARIEHPNGKPQKSILKDITAGTCKPGERADVTGCTPATQNPSQQKPTQQQQQQPKRKASEVTSIEHLKVLDSVGAEIQKNPEAKAKAVKVYHETRAKLTEMLPEISHTVIEVCDSWLFEEAIDAMQGHGVAIATKVSAWAVTKAYLGIRKLMAKSTGNVQQEIEQLKKVMQVLCEQGGFKMPSDDELKRMIEQKQSVKTKSFPHYVMKIDKPREFSCVMAELEGEAEQKVLDMIDTINDADLTGDGKENDPHITLKFGLQPDSYDDVVSLLKNQGPITVKFGKTSLFKHNDEEVVKIDVESTDCHEVNALLNKLPHTDTYPDYRPHVTLAYVLPGRGAKYENMSDLEGETAVIMNLTYSDPNSVKTSIALSGPMKVKQVQKSFGRGFHYRISKSLEGPKTIAVDLDGTIIEYDGFKGTDHYGQPREGAKESLDLLKKEGWEIIIWTCRGNVDAVADHLDTHGIVYDYINNNPNQPEDTSQKVVADVYIDDRAINAKRPWDKILEDVFATQKKQLPKKVEKKIKKAVPKLPEKTEEELYKEFREMAKKTLNGDTNG